MNTTRRRSEAAFCGLTGQPAEAFKGDSGKQMVYGAVDAKNHICGLLNARI
jgi:hypothetical protein